MAAVLCQSIGNLFAGCGDVICLPCKACGIGCSSLCEAMSSAFFPYIFLTFALNIAPLALGLQSIPDIATGCVDSGTWMLVSGIFALIHMIGCLYIVKQVKEENLDSSSNMAHGTVTAVQHQPEDDFVKVQIHDNVTTTDTKGKADIKKGADTRMEKMESATAYAQMEPDDTAPSNTWGRIKHVLCYDKGVALYIVLSLVWMIWLTMGVSKFLMNDDQNCGNVGGRILTTLSCGWLYISLVGVVFLCSMCCMRL